MILDFRGLQDLGGLTELGGWPVPRYHLDCITTNVNPSIGLEGLPKFQLTIYSFRFLTALPIFPKTSSVVNTDEV